MLGEVTKAAKRLDVPTQIASMQEASGAPPEPVLLLRHGTHTLLCRDRVTHVLLFYPINVTEKDGQKIAALAEEELSDLFQIIRREMLSGRTGFSISFDETKDTKVLQQVRLEQRIIVDDADPTSVQRLSDGIQELVVTAQRVVEILNQAFSKKPGGGATASTEEYKPPDEPPPDMIYK